MADGCPLLTPVTDRLAGLEARAGQLDEICKILQETVNNHIPTLITQATDKIEAAVLTLNGRLRKLELALFFVAGLATGLGILEGIQTLK